jgi:NADPH-dependent glutamate synthase beta subunit-like oxidoreductase/Pyruvate/2-oxoacid:ferredoxin oxidoreductase delta subunit
MKNMNIVINGQKLQAPEGATVFEAAREAGIYIPALCAHPERSPFACRICLIEVEGREDLPTSCTLPVTEGMVIHTDTPRVSRQRRKYLKRILEEHPSACLNCSRLEPCDGTVCQRKVDYLERCVTCPKNERCELQKVARYVGLGETALPYSPRKLPVHDGDPFFLRDYNLCIRCGQCVAICDEILGVGAISLTAKDSKVDIGTRLGGSLKDSGCKFCGVCVEICPTSALIQKIEKDKPLSNRETALVPCRFTCPADIDIPRYIRLIAEGKLNEAFAVVKEKAPLGAVLAHVCPHPCEEECRRKELNQPIAIRALKRVAAEHDDDKWRSRIKKLAQTDKKVAVIGAGPAGLTAAYYLARQGHAVTILEATSRPGGMLWWGIPRFQLPQEILEREIKDILSIGVELKLNHRVENLEKLFQDGFHAVFVAIGLQEGRKLGIPGAEGDNILIAIPFLAAANSGEKVKLGKKVLVLGGGDVAVDAARVARRLGAAQAHMACLESRETMPAHSWLVKEAEEEGVVIHPSLSFTEIIRKNGKVSGVKCLKVKWMKFDEEGKLHLETIPNSEVSLEADTVIFAIGQRLQPIKEAPGISLSKRQTIAVDPETLETGYSGVFAGGDAVSGPGSVVQAIAMGRKSAQTIDKFLGGTGNIEETLAEKEKVSPWLGREEGFCERPRNEPALLPAEQRIKGFEEVELSLEEKAAIAEARRCLRCDLRVTISKTLPHPIKSKKSLLTI